LTELIQREITHRMEGRPAGIIAKCNSVTDTSLIEQLYAASQAGVAITLLVRGVCCLRPGIPGLSENIRIASIVGRFLEHSRVFLFENGGDEEIYLGSADIMHRNLDRRVEVLFPIENKQHRLRIQHEILRNALADNTKIRWLHPDGNYRRSDNKVPPHNFQENLLVKHCSVAKHSSART
jgi:polyphosphate kinase